MFESPTKRQPSGRKKRSYIETTKTHEKEKRSINGKKREQDERTKASIPLLTISKRCQCQPALCAVKMVKLQVKDSVINTSRFTNLSSSAISDIIVLEYLVDGQKITELVENEIISLYFSTKNESVTNGQVYCVFLNGTEWSEKGMNVGTVDENEVECRSNHLSSFAMFVLVNNDGGGNGDGDGDDDDGHKYHTNSSGKQPISDANKKAIEYISYIGSGLSLVGLFLTSVVYFFLCKDLKILTTTRHLVHFNLQIALGLTQIVFLAGGNATDNEIICKIVAIIMHYFSLAAFSWIFLEVVLLHLKLISVYGGEYVKMKTFYLVGWGFPLVIVGLTAGITTIEDIDYYGRTGEWCWLSYKNGFKWIFFAPIIIISSVTLVAVIAVSRVLFLLSKSEGGNRKNRIITAARGAVILFPTLGLSWAFSVVAVNHDALVWKYLFAIFTSLQGFLIFLIYGVCNKEIRTAVVRKIGWDFHPDASTA